MKAKIYMPAVSLKLLKPRYQCTLHSISGTVLAHITTSDVKLAVSWYKPRAL